MLLQVMQHDRAGRTLETDLSAIKWSYRGLCEGAGYSSCRQGYEHALCLHTTYPLRLALLLAMSSRAEGLFFHRLTAAMLIVKWACQCRGCGHRDTPPMAQQQSDPACIRRCSPLCSSLTRLHSGLSLCLFVCLLGYKKKRQRCL